MWFQKSADQNFAKAQNDLGALYAEGRGTARDFVQASKWLLLAEQGGYNVSQKTLDWLKTQMTPEQTAEAQRLADSWANAHPRPIPPK